MTRKPAAMNAALSPRGVVAWIVAFALLVALAGCQPLAHPEALRVNVVGVDPLRGHGMELRFAVKLRVQNPNDLAVDFDGLSVDLELNGEHFASGVSDQKGTLPRFGETVLTVAVSVSTISAIRVALALNDAAQRGELPYVVRGKLSGGLFGSVMFTHSGTLKLPQ
jgi:LEA14-like dessication related protein